MKHALTEHYRELFRQHGPVAASVQGSEEGMMGRYEQLAKVADLSRQSVLDPGCGYGALYDYLCKSNKEMKYRGIDLAPESIKYASRTYADATWECRDMLIGVRGELSDPPCGGQALQRFAPRHDRVSPERSPWPVQRRMRRRQNRHRAGTSGFRPFHRCGGDSQ